jgi:hypothetical protein
VDGLWTHWVLLWLPEIGDWCRGRVLGDTTGSLNEESGILHKLLVERIKADEHLVAVDSWFLLLS